MRVIAIGSRVVVVLAAGMAVSALLTVLLERLVLASTHAIGPGGWVGAVLVLVLGLGLYRRSTQRPESEIRGLESEAMRR